jgi:hypothetical protein
MPNKRQPEDPAARTDIGEAVKYLSEKAAERKARLENEWIRALDQETLKQDEAERMRRE